MRTLYPPLSQIEAELFRSDRGRTPSGDVPHLEYVPTSEATETRRPMPDLLRELVERRLASQQAHPPASLAVGQIRLLDQVPSPDAGGRLLGRTCAMLLGAGLGGGRWSGWLVAQESDYASMRDLVLQEGDGPVAPEAAMVQAWNPVECTLRGDEPILGKLPPERLDAVALLADPRLVSDDFVAPRTGLIGAWDLDAQHTVVTGTPLGDDSDPRHAYQGLYLRLAQEISTASQRAPAPAPESAMVRALDWLRQALVRPAFTFAALAIAVLQGIWILAPQDARTPDGPVYRSATPVAGSGTPNCTPAVQVTFRPDASHADVLAALQQADAEVTRGPTVTGELQIQSRRGQDSAALAAQLRQSAVVEQADAVQPDPQRCAAR